jgi:hypothetical protein
MSFSLIQESIGAEGSTVIRARYDGADKTGAHAALAC